MRNSLLFILSGFFLSCNTKSDPKDHPAHSSENKSLRTVKTIKKDSINNDTIEFISYNDNFDYAQLTGRKGKEEFIFINDNNNDRSFLRGDLISIQWKNDSIFIPGDGETPQNAQWIIAAKKVKDGRVSNFRKQYPQPVKYYWAEEYDFSQSYLDELYRISEYYLANSGKELITLSIKNKEPLSYSIEKQTRNKKEYIVLGISVESENRISVIQWLYLDPENNRLYEYDLANDKFIRFK